MFNLKFPEQNAAATCCFSACIDEDLRSMRPRDLVNCPMSSGKRAVVC